MCLELRPFNGHDWEVAKDVLEEPAVTCVRLLHQRPTTDLFIAEAGYGQDIWKDQKLCTPSDIQASLGEKPVGVVLHGALEVSERFVHRGVSRRRTTRVLRPGDFFGLFEAVGNLHGFWQISAGVKRFLITNRLGNATVLARRGWSGISDGQLNTLKHLKNADFDYSELVNFALGRSKPPTDAQWRCTILLFDLAKIVDPEAKLPLLEAAASQLASLARQNPPESLYENLPEPGQKAERGRVAATLDAILSDHIPVLGLYRPQAHCEFGPFEHVYQAVEALIDPPSSLPEPDGAWPHIHLWIPDTWSRCVPKTALYLDALAGRFDMDAADQLLKVGTRPRRLRSGTVITRLDNPGDDSYRVRVETSGGELASLQRIRVRRKENRIPHRVYSRLFPVREASYGWPAHLGNGFLLTDDHERP